MFKIRLSRTFFFMIVVLFLTASTTAMESNQSHCYAIITRMDERNNGSSKIIKTECFNTFAGSMLAATNGRVRLNPSVLPESVTEEMLNSGMDPGSLLSQVVIGIDWDSAGFTGSSYTWVVNGETGCTSTTQFSISSMPTGWDNRVSSARGYSGCNYYYHLPEHKFWWGINCL